MEITFPNSRTFQGSLFVILSYSFFNRVRVVNYQILYQISRSHLIHPEMHLTASHRFDLQRCTYTWSARCMIRRAHGCCATDSKRCHSIPQALQWSECLRLQLRVIIKELQASPRQVVRPKVCALEIPPSLVLHFKTPQTFKDIQIQTYSNNIFSIPTICGVRVGLWFQSASSG